MSNRKNWSEIGHILFQITYFSTERKYISLKFILLITNHQNSKFLKQNIFHYFISRYFRLLLFNFHSYPNFLSSHNMHPQFKVPKILWAIEYKNFVLLLTSKLFDFFSGLKSKNVSFNVSFLLSSSPDLS